MEQMQLLMALSLYLNSIRNNPVGILVPATPEMLFGSGVNEEEIESDDDYEYEYEEDEEVPEETDEISPSTPENAPSNWKSGSRVTELGDDDAGFTDRSARVSRYLDQS
jgi:hypothetical protein